MPEVHFDIESCMQDLSAQLKELSSRHEAKEMEYQTMLAQMVRTKTWQFEMLLVNHSCSIDVWLCVGGSKQRSVTEV